MLAVSNKLQSDPSSYLKRLYFDAISYHPSALQCLIDHVGVEGIMFGTDNPFFPPLNTQDVVSAVWPSTRKVYQCIEEVSMEGGVGVRAKILYANAQRILKL
ncbi:hypothetical protein EON63_13455 [archaeon]|nr:MAG: hypothetical protein EON63_13455 [archaeon]